MAGDWPTPEQIAERMIENASTDALGKQARFVLSSIGSDLANALGLPWLALAGLLVNEQVRDLS